MAVKVSSMRSGYLVLIDTNTPGNRYQITTVIKPEHVTSDGETSTLVEVDKRYRDKEEQDEADKVRSKARSLIESACIKAEFNWYCAAERLNDLRAREAEANALVEAFNALAKTTQIKLHVHAIKVETNDEAALRDIRAAIRQNLETIMDVLKKPDINEEGREAAKAARAQTRKLSKLLEPGVQAGIEGAMAMSAEVQKAINKVGMAKAAEEAKRTIEALEQQRLAFLDFDSGSQIEAPTPDAGRVVEITEVPKKPSKKPRSGPPSKEAA
jgi:hypothetical protein